MTQKKILVGTRGSRLALIQTEIAIERLQNVCPGLEISAKTITITTRGDTDLSPVPLDAIGKGWFTRELETAVLTGEIDLAVHSLKDLPEELPEGLMIGGLFGREDPSDVLVTRDGEKLGDLPKGARVGTDSRRRQIQLLALRPDLRVESIRGNVPTRLAKLDAGEYHAVVLAAAGLIRLGLSGRISQKFSIDDITPAPGQGILAFEIRSGNAEVAELARRADDPLVSAAARAERAFARQFGGGCQSPVGALARINQNSLELLGMAVSPDGKKIIRDRLIGGVRNGESLGRLLADKIKLVLSA